MRIPTKFWLLSSLSLIWVYAYQFNDAEHGSKISYIFEVLRTHNHLHKQQCGSLKDRYLQKYSELMKVPESQRKYLIAIPNISGLADRIVGFVSVFAFAMLSDRIFQIGQRKPLLPIESAFSSPYLNWSRDTYDPDWMIEPLQYKARERNYNNSILQLRKYNALNTLDDWKLQDKFLRKYIPEVLGAEFQYSLIVINRGKTIRLFENQNHVQQLKDMGLTPYNAFGCIVDFLLAPRPTIFLPIFTSLQRLHRYLDDRKSASHPQGAKSGTLVIAIQIRTGDDTFFAGKDNHLVDHFSSFFSCAKQIEQFALSNHSIDPHTNRTYTRAKWFLVSDSAALRKAALETFGPEKIITNIDIPIEHSSKEARLCSGQTSNCDVSTEGFTAAAGEWWLMSFARYHVITQFSGFGRSAAMHSLYPNSIYTIPSKKSRSEVLCSETTFTDLENLSYDWSGI